MTELRPEFMPWRVGSHIGRTIYACPPGSSYRKGEIVIGMMDSGRLAEEVVAAHNFMLQVRSQITYTSSGPRQTGKTPHITPPETGSAPAQYDGKVS